MVLVKKIDGGAVLGISNSRALVDMSTRDLSLDSNTPLWKPRGTGDCYVCMDSISLTADVLRYSDGVFNDATNVKSILKSVIPKMKAVLNAHGLLLTENRWDGPLFIITPQKIFKISNYFTVSEVEDCGADGFSYYLTGAMAEAKGHEPEKAVAFAYETMGRMLNVNPFPLIIFNTKTKKRKILRRSL